MLKGLNVAASIAPHSHRQSKRGWMSITEFELISLAVLEFPWHACKRWWLVQCSLSNRPIRQVNQFYTLWFDCHGNCLHARHFAIAFNRNSSAWNAVRIATNQSTIDYHVSCNLCRENSVDWSSVTICFTLELIWRWQEANADFYLCNRRSHVIFGKWHAFIFFHWHCYFNWSKYVFFRNSVYL